MKRIIASFVFATLLLAGVANAAAQQSATQALTLTVQASPVVVTTNHLPNAITTTVYSQTILASGGIGPYTFSVSAGTLPPGLTLTSAGVLAGLPTTAGTSSFTIQAKDTLNAVGTQAFSNFIVYQKLVFTTTTLPTATFGVPYSANIAFTGGAAPYACSVTGTLPTGLSVTTSGMNCVLSGSPTQTGQFTFSVLVNDNSQLALLQIKGVLYAGRR